MSKHYTKKTSLKKWNDIRSRLLWHAWENATCAWDTLAPAWVHVTHSLFKSQSRIFYICETLGMLEKMCRTDTFSDTSEAYRIISQNEPACQFVKHIFLQGISTFPLVMNFLNFLSCIISYEYGVTHCAKVKFAGKAYLSHMFEQWNWFLRILKNIFQLHIDVCHFLKDVKFPRERSRINLRWARLNIGSNTATLWEGQESWSKKPQNFGNGRGQTPEKETLTFI